MILVINESESAPQQVSLNNQALAATVQARYTPQWHSDSGIPGFGMSLFSDPHSPRDVLLVDRFSAGCKLPAKGGVGHARKIGADLAVSLIYRQRVRSPWIHCTDADVQLPNTYFSCIETAPNIGPGHAALVYPFQHGEDRENPEKSDHKEVVLATQLYELSLRYYVAGMKFAHSPYAFHTIGSTMAVRANHYAKVRGFPKREAGEDFYLLNKLAKVGSVLELNKGADCEPIRIAARRSDRVPFGTGAAVNKITALTDPVKEFRFYHPAVFQSLQHWLQTLPVIWQSQSRELMPDFFPDQPALLAGLKNIGVNQALDHAFRQSNDLDQFTRQMHTWFDAFRTLKLVHALRDDYLPSVSYAVLAASDIFGQLLVQDPDLLAFHQQLRQKLG